MKDKVTVQNTKFPEVKIIIPKVYRDQRGFFFESFNKEVLKQKNITIEAVQENFSKSNKNVLRGLHYQHEPAMGKLIRVLRGKIYDVVVDIRKDSDTFGEWLGIELSEENFKQILIPKGFAHGFLALSDCEIQYICNALYNPTGESGILWNDPDLNIDWKIDNPILSEKDMKLQSFKEYSNYPDF